MNRRGFLSALLAAPMAVPAIAKVAVEEVTRPRLRAFSGIDGCSSPVGSLKIDIDTSALDAAVETMKLSQKESVFMNEFAGHGDRTFKGFPLAGTGRHDALPRMQEQMTRSLFAPIDPVTKAILLHRDAYVIPNCCDQYVPRVPNRLFGVELNEHGEAI